MKDDNTLSLPKGWEIKKLGEVAKADYGYTEKASSEEIGPKFLRITDIQDGSVNWDTVPFCKIIDSDLEKYKLIEGDIVFARTGATTGKSYLITCPPKSVFASYLIKVHIISKELSPQFLFHYFQTKTYWDSINSGISGSAQGGFNATKLSELEIHFPPLPEQQRIVATLDQAFEGIAIAKANAEQNLKNAKELFESYLQEVFDKKGEGWDEKKIQDITRIINGYAFASKDFSPTNSVKSIKITNVGVKEFVEENDNYLPEKYNETLKEFQVKEGNIVIALTRTIIAAGLKVAVVPKSYNGALINQRVAALIPNEKLVNQRYLYNFLTTHGVSKYVLDHVNTLMQPNLSINDLKNMLIPLPTLAEQQAIVAKLDALSTETRRLEAIYQQKIADLEELKKSILQKAFNGELKTIQP